MSGNSDSLPSYVSKLQSVSGLMHLKSKIEVNLNSIIKFSLKCLALCISYCIPKSNRIWIFGGWFGERFADNSRYFYLYCHYNKQKFGLDRVIWVTRNPRVYTELKVHGCEVYKFWSFSSIWYHLRGRVHVIDQSFRDINDIFSVRSKIINLWHGFPLKKIGRYCTETQGDPTYLTKFLKCYCADPNLTKLLKYFYADLNLGFNEKNYFLLATSEFSAEILGQAFGVKQENILLSGYPRNDMFQLSSFGNYITGGEQIVLTEIIKKIKSGTKIIVYLPTFRDCQNTSPLGITAANELAALSEFLVKHNILLITKFHFAEKDFSSLRMEDLGNIINLHPESDVYPFLRVTDILITDYSSVYFDFLLTQKPIIFYPYDYEYYAHEDRGFIFPYQEYTPGPKVYNLAELQVAILHFLDTRTTDDEYAHQRELLRDKIFDSSRIPGSEYLVNEIKKKVLSEKNVKLSL